MSDTAQTPIAFVPVRAIIPAIQAIAPHADSMAWATNLVGPMMSAGITTPKRAAAFIANVAEESGLFTALAENLFYSQAAHLFAVYPHQFASLDDAAQYTRNPVKLANHVYADRLGNGDESSGDGWLYRGGGAIQMTGRSSYTAFAAASGHDIASTPDWVRTIPGAAASACWFWSDRGGLNDLADQWSISEITRRINGPAMLGNADRIAYANKLLPILQAATAVS
jgi:putative chitinase